MLGSVIVGLAWNPASLNGQSRNVLPNAAFTSLGYDLGPPPTVGIASGADSPTPGQGAAGAGLTIIPTFAANIDQATQNVINSAIDFYKSTFTNNITIHIEFYSMNNGLGSSFFAFYTAPYSSYRTALGNSAASTDDATALANTPPGAVNPINAGVNIGIKPATGIAVGLNTPEVLLAFPGSPCPGFTGSGCIGINVALANSLGDLISVVEHEMDEILGLGSALNGTTTPATPWVEDLFRWASSGVRSYSANASATNPCAGPHAFLSIDGGATNLNEFNNCNNGGDYGDWISHTPSQVQDAFTNATASPSLSAGSSEVRALDVIGYNVKKRAHGQITSN